MVRLPHGSFPAGLLVAHDGSLWVSESSGDALAQVSPAGRVRQHRIGTSDASPGRLVEAPDGTIWFPGFELIGRVAPGGRVTGYANFGPNRIAAVGFPQAAAWGPDDALWYTNDESMQITRLSSDGAFRTIDLPHAGDDLAIAGIASDEDDALWLTEAHTRALGERDAIGRLTVDGRYRRWLLPRHPTGAADIVRGPDGAMWFTERAGYRIGRIDRAGRLEEFALPAGTVASEIVAGRADELWFTTDTQVGRVTTSGRVRMWPVPGAQELTGLAVDPRGGLWVADGKADLVRHVDPPTVDDAGR